MQWWQALLVALTTYAVTKVVDHFFAIFRERRDFRRHRRETAFAEIEELKDEIGRLFELSANWKAYDVKAEEYARSLARDDHLIGKYNKYPEIAAAARDTLHWCKIVASQEHSAHDDLIQNKKELGEKYKKFIQACEAYVESLV